MYVFLFKKFKAPFKLEERYNGIYNTIISLRFEPLDTQQHWAQ